MDYNKTIVCEQVEKLSEELSTLSQNIWNYAEPRKQEVKSVAAITKLLKKYKFHVTSNYMGIATAFSAVYPDPTKNTRPTTSPKPGVDKKPHVAFLCRYDAKVKDGHVRGNNLVTEVAVGAALAVRMTIELSCPEKGKITVIGCPDSSNGGVVPFVNKGAFKEVDVVLMAVPGPRTEWCPLYMGRKIVQVDFKEEDRPTRAETVRPEGLTCAAVAVQNLMTIREHFAKDWKTNATFGARPSLRPQEDRITMDGHVRMCMKARSDGEMHLMERRVWPCMEGAAKAMGCHMDVSYIYKTFYSFVNNKQLAYLLQLNAYFVGTLATPLKPAAIEEPIDEGNVSHVVPTIRPMFHIGHHADVGTQEFKKAVNSKEAQVYTIAMTKAMGMTCLDVLNGGMCLARIKADLKNSLSEVKGVTFKPFPVSSLPSNMVQLQVPYGGNFGWSRTI